MKPIDACGNMLNDKDYVAVKIGSEVFQALISEIKESSILLDDKKRLPGAIQIMIPWTIIYSSDAPRIPTLFKLVKPVGFDGKIPGMDPKS